MVEVLEVEKMRGGRVRVVLDNGDRYVLLRSALLDRPLQAGQEVDPAEFSHWVTLRQYRPALDRAVALLAARACSRGEIEQKLRRAGYCPEAVEMVITKLDINDLLDDQAFADQWAASRASQKYGPRRIAQELKMKGVSAEETQSALDSLSDEDQLSAAVRLAEKALSRSRTGEDPRKARQRALGMIVRRGYDWDIARQAVDRVLGEEEE